jgi:very-short-patch-repair endonuclease
LHRNQKTSRARSLRRRMSPPEARMWNLLRGEPFDALHFRRQVPIGPYFADFAAHGCRLVIEIDSAQHFTDAAIAYDSKRTAFLEAAGYRVLRFNTVDVLNHLGGVAELVLAACPPPTAQ